MRYGDLEFINFCNVLDCVEHRLDRPSRADVAKDLSLSRTTASIIANKLVALGVLQEEQVITAGRGRPGTPLSVDTSTWFAIGAAYHPPQWAFVITNLRGEIVERHTIFLEDISKKHFVQTLIKGLQYMLDRCPGKLFPALAVGVPGVIDTKTGTILYAYDLNWQEPMIAFREKIEQHFNMRTYILNRYRASSLAEFRYGKWKGIPNMLYLGIGTGMRSSLFVDGKLVEGQNFSAGRIAHIQVDPDGPLCGCGQRGCLQEMCNEQALLRSARELRQSQNGTEFKDSPLWKVDPEDYSILRITAAADAGDPFACACVDIITAPLIKVLAIMIDTLDPQVAIIGGPLGNCCAYLVQRVKSELKRMATTDNLKNLDVVQSSVDSYGSAAGAVSVALEHKLELLLPFATRQD